MLEPLANARPQIMIVDDRPEQFEVIRRLLRPIGETYHAMTALDALTLSTEGHFDMILLDILLGTSNGLQVAAVLRKGKLFPSSPIIAYSANWDPKPDELIAAGCNDFLTVPFADG